MTNNPTPEQMALGVIDDWAVKQIGKLSERCNEVRGAVALDDPEYRMLLGQHVAFTRLRSFIHGARRAHLKGSSDGR